MLLLIAIPIWVSWVAIASARFACAEGQLRGANITAVSAGESGGVTEVARPLTGRRLIKLLGDRNILLNTISYLCTNYLYYLLSFWSFLYLVQVRHFSGIEAGMVGALPWIGAGVGAAAGGFLSDWLAERIGVRWGYRLVPLLTLPAAGLLLLVTLRVATPYAAVAALTVAFFMVEINEGAYWATMMRVARSDIAAASGVLNTGANVGGIIAQPLVGFLTNSGAWGGAFMTGIVFALVAAGHQCPLPGAEFIFRARF